MDKYEKLLDVAKEKNLSVYEKIDMGASLKGLYVDKNIALSKDLDTDPERASVLAEEIGHYCTTSGNIIDQTSQSNRKQELKARVWSYNSVIGIAGLVDAYKHHCKNLYETAEFLEVSETMLSDALSCYKSKYGDQKINLDNFIIQFEPNLTISEIIIFDQEV